MMPCDLLMAIMQHCASAQLSVMMRTCRTLHRDGVGPRLLLQRDIPINSAKKLESYIAFIEAGKGVVTRSIPFSSPSTAGAVAWGHSCNGRREWIASDGSTFGDWESRGVE